jgi:hypothetical protein
MQGMKIQGLLHYRLNDGRLLNDRGLLYSLRRSLGLRFYSLNNGLDSTILHFQKSTNSDFSKDLIILKQSFSKLSDAYRIYFHTVTPFKLPFHAGYISAKTQSIMRQYSLLPAEHQMSFSLGKLFGVHQSLLYSLSMSLKPLLADTAKSTPELQAKLLVIDSALNHHLTATPHLDPRVLSHQIACFDQSSLCSELGKKAYNLSHIFLSTQVSIPFLALMAMHFGVPMVVSVATSLLASLLCMFF